MPKRIRPFGEEIGAVVLPATPAVISVGARSNRVYGFFRPPGHEPFFLLPGEDGKGKRKSVPFHVRHRVPIVKAGGVARKVSKTSWYLRRRLYLAVDSDSSQSPQYVGGSSF